MIFPNNQRVFEAFLGIIVFWKFATFVAQVFLCLIFLNTAKADANLAAVAAAKVLADDEKRQKRKKKLDAK